MPGIYQPGERIDHYKIIRPPGRGGASHVYLAQIGMRGCVSSFCVCHATERREGRLRMSGAHVGTSERWLHYRRDVTLREDHSQVRKGTAPRVQAVLNSFL